jgi:HAMP domain-containing protein
VVDLSTAGAETRLTASTRRTTALLFTMVVVTLLAAIVFVNRTLLRRLKALAAAASRIKDGDLDQTIEVEGEDEISELVESINKMTKSLKRSLLELDENREYLETVINSIEDEIVIVDRELRIVAANNTYLLHCTRKREDIMSEACFLVSQDSLFSCTEPLVQACPAKHVFESGRVQKHRLQFRDQSGQNRTIEVYCYPIRDLAGEVRHVIEVRREVDRRSSEIEV